MRILVESLKRMYTVKKTLTKEQVAERVARGSISADSFCITAGVFLPCDVFIFVR